MYRNGRLTLFGDSVLCNSSGTCSIGSTWCWNINGYCQMVDYRIHHPCGVIANTGWLIQPGGIAAWNLGLFISCPRHLMDNAQVQQV